MKYFGIKRIVKTTILVCYFITIFSACEKEGPAGPTGATGPQGPAGPAGPQGQAGTNNQVTLVTLTNWVAISSSPAQWTCGGNLPAITQNVLNNGNIFAYWSQGGSQTLMPFTQNGIEFMYFTNIVNGAGSLQVYVTKAGPFATVAPSYYAPVTLKVIVQP